MSFLHGAKLIQVSLGEFQLRFDFHPPCSIVVEGHWELLNSTGERIDCAYSGPERPPYLLHQLLGRHVVESEVSAPHWFALRFDSGHVLRVFDSSDEFESFSILPQNIFV